MKIAIVGLWHLGTVTAACLASIPYTVLGYDENEAVIGELNKAHAPIFESQLDALLSQGLSSGYLQFSSNHNEIADADVIWVTYDTPVDNNDNADIDVVMNAIINIFPFFKQNAIVLISSQLPVGSTKILKQKYAEYYPNKKVFFAYSPENLRLGKAIEIFTKPDRIVIGVDDESIKPMLKNLFQPLSDNLIWMSIASAEMTKHAINAFLATSVVFANEIASLCEYVGADASEVEKGLKSEKRIGPLAYLKPGPAFAGGTLARDVSYLINMGKKNNFQTQLFPAVIQSNLAHKKWVHRRLQEVLGTLKNKQICMLGLTYKPQTNTLRRSAVIETCEWLNQQGAKITAYDPMLNVLPEEYHYIHIKNNFSEAFSGAQAIVVSTDHADFFHISAEDILKYINPVFIFDAAGFLQKQFQQQKGITYFSVGRT